MQFNNAKISSSKKYVYIYIYIPLSALSLPLNALHSLASEASTHWGAEWKTFIATHGRIWFSLGVYIYFSVSHAFITWSVQEQQKRKSRSTHDSMVNTCQGKDAGVYSTKQFNSSTYSGIGCDTSS